MSSRLKRCYRYQSPSSFDLRRIGVLRYPCSEQQSCGSCWCFSIAACLESRIESRYNMSFTERTLSPQQLLDNCGSVDGCFGSEGGSIRGGFRVIVREGLTLEKTLPYRAKESQNPNRNLPPAVSITSYERIETNEKAMIKCLEKEGSFVVVMCLGSKFDSYSGGLLEEKVVIGMRAYLKSNRKLGENHAMVLISHGPVDGGDDEHGTVPYWLFRNSYGANWGGDEKGHVKIPKSVTHRFVQAWSPIGVKKVPRGGL